MLKLVHAATDMHDLCFWSSLSVTNLGDINRPEVPDTLKAPAGEKVVLQAHATGVQIYGCQAGADGKLAWTLKRPEADLFDPQGKKIGQHGAGPSWKHNDGSEVIGKMAAKADAPSAGSIPWLLVNVTNHSGSGVLSRVTTIQRIHTQGGQPPSAADCDSTHANSEVKIKYSADYYFYAPNQ
jgi:hypothetical protein